MGNHKKKVGLAILRYVLMILIFIGAFIGIKWFYDQITIDTYTAPLTPVEIEKAEVRTVSKTMVLSATVESKSVVPVSSYVDGTILEYLVDEGDYIENGDVIAKIDPEPYRLQYEQAKAGYSGYASSFERVEKLYKQNIATKQDYDTLKAQKEAFENQLELAKLQLSYTDVVAHSSGVVQKKISSEGATASKGVPLALVSDLENLTVNVSVGEKYYDIFRKNADNISITIVRPESKYSETVVGKAEIDNVAKFIDPLSKSFKVSLTLTENKEEFVPGMYVKVYITYDSKEGYALSSNCVKLDGTAYYVEDGIARCVDLSKCYSNSEYYILPEELKDKSFINKGKTNVLDGEEVNILEGESK